MQNRSGKIIDISERGDMKTPAARGASDADTVDNSYGTAFLPESAGPSLGIPETELTPSVRRALASLQRETERLRRQVELANARLNDATINADQDVLLPILNRRAFVREITRFIAFAERYGTPSSLVYMDLDRFKAVNDLHGHIAGDAVLKHFANVILGQIRDSDIFARVGGDEFAVILAHATLDQAVRKGEKFVKALNKQPAIWNGKPVALNFSFGAYRLQPGETADATIAHADEAMYVRKRARPPAQDQRRSGDDIGQ
jgi:diguanylate cyclase (GGDEF)-like protein